MAADQIEIQIPKPVVEEQSAFTATAYFRQRSDGTAATPTTVDYRIDNLTAGEEIRGWTTVSPATSASISITSSDNNIQQGFALRSGGKTWERIQMIVSINRGTDTEVNKHKTWRVMNRFGVG